MRNNTNDFELECEKLEERKMLSTVEVFAAGATNTETIELQINEVPVQVWNNVGGDASTNEFISLVYETPDTVDPGDIRIAFTNDLFDPANGIDRDVRIDKIVVDGVTFETEAPDVFSTGTYDANGLSPGFKQNDILHSNGYFQYPSGDTGTGDGSEVTIRVRGDEGTEQFNLLIDDTIVGSYNVSQQFQTIRYTHTGTVAPEDVKVEFTNDGFDPANNFDPNLVVDFITIDGTTYETEAPTVFSTGVWNSTVDRATPGFRQQERLHANGFFQYNAISQVAQTIEIRARGDEGTERFNLLEETSFQGEPGTRVLASFDVTQEFETYTYFGSSSLAAAQLRIEFVNDEFDAANGIDSNLTVDNIALTFNNGVRTVYETEAPTVFSTATYSQEAGSVTSGFFESETLHGNGYFEYGVDIPTEPFDIDSVTEIPREETEALVALYNASYPDARASLLRWLQTDTPSNWAGVIVRDGNVVSLQFQPGIAEIPPEIENFTQLETLNLSFNGIRILPAEIGNLASLQELRISSNDFGALPPEIGNLTNLLRLDVGFNGLTGLPPEIGNLSSLEMLRASSNNFASLPAEITNLANLSLLSLGRNPLNTVPIEIQSLTNLVRLDLPDTGLTTLPSWITDFEFLRDLELQDNSLTSLPSEIVNLPSLRMIDLRRNPLNSVPNFPSDVNVRR